MVRWSNLFPIPRPRLAFVSYRRADSLAYAALLREKLANAFGQKAVFRDTSSIERGRDFEIELQDRLENSTVALVVIGRQFVASFRSRNAKNRPRNAKKDWVLEEVKRALELKTKVVAPIYIAGTPPIRPGDLPVEIRDLANRQGFEIRDNELDRDIEALVQWLEQEGFIRQDRLTFGKVLLRALPGFLGLLLLAVLLVWVQFAIGFGQSWIVLIALGAVMFVIFQQVIPFGAVTDDRPALMSRVTRWACVVTFVSILAFILLGMTVRWPTDLTRELNPEIVKRYPFPREPVLLDRVSDEVVFVETGQDKGDAAIKTRGPIDPEELKSSMDGLNKALVNGLIGSGGGHSFFFELQARDVAKSDQSRYYDKNRNYESFDGVLVFTPPPKARLLSGIGILIQSVSPGRWRQVELDIPASNWSPSAATRLANFVQNLRIDAGDRLLFVLNFAPIAGAAPKDIGLDVMEVMFVPTQGKGVVPAPSSP